MKGDSNEATIVKGNPVKRRPWLFVLTGVAAVAIAAGVIIGVANNKKGAENTDRDMNPESLTSTENTEQDINNENLSYINVEPDVVKSSWAVLGISKADGSGFAEVKDQYIVFDDLDMRYYENGELVMNCSYRFADEYTIELVNHDDVKDQRSWLLQELKRDTGSEITITDSGSDLKYYIELAPSFEDPEAAKRVTMDYLDGWWRMTETSQAGVRENLPDNWMYFADGRMYYYENGIQVTDNAVSLDKQTLVMTNELLGVTLYWETRKEANGDVVYKDSAGIEYYCTRGEGYSSLKPDGFWEMYAVSVVDGSNYSSLSSCYLVFSGDSCKYYVGGKLTTDNTFYWLDDWTINITTQDGTTDEWVIIDRGSGHAMITGKNRMLAYYVKRTSPIDFDPAITGDPVPDEELQGAWNVLSWKLLDGTQYTEPEGWQFVFEDGSIKYYISGVLVNTNSYSFTDPTHMKLTTISSYDGEGVGDSTKWELKINDGIVTIKDRNLGLIYRMSKDETDLGESVDITSDMLQGAWKVVSSDAEGFNADKSWAFTFEDNNVVFKGDNTYRYTYSLKDNVITADLTGYDFQQTWKLALTEDGRLTIAIGGNYTYICEKDSGDGKQEEETSAVTNAELAGTWTGSIGEIYTFDGKGACTVDFSKSTYPTLETTDYTYTLDETTGKATATYSGGTQNWTFTKAADGKITMAVAETAYSTPLTKAASGTEETKAVTNAELAGTWTGSIGEIYTFDGKGACTVDFSKSTYPTLETTDYTYTLDETTGKATATYSGGTQNWTFTKAADGKITMAVAETAYSTPLTKAASGTEETKAVTNAELAGTWKVVSSDAESFNADKSWAFTFEDNNVVFKGDNTYKYTYSLKDNVITADLTGYDFQQTWKLALTEDGRLTIAIGGNYTYICEKDSGDGKQEEETSAVTNAELAGTWTGSIGEIYTFDGKGACTVDFSKSTYPTLETTDYTYTLDETTGKAVATYSGGTQNWTFTKAADGKITMEIKETAYSTPLTKAVTDTTTTTRATLVTMLYRLAGEPKVSGTNQFADVESGTWYTDAVIWAVENGIVNGYSDNKFGTDAEITREQFAVIMYRYAKYKGYDVSKTADLSGYTDASSISGWARTAMKWANAEGLITGRTSTTLSPKGSTTSAEAEAILNRFIEKVK